MRYKYDDIKQQHQGPIGILHFTYIYLGTYTFIYF